MVWCWVAEAWCWVVVCCARVHLTQVAYHEGEGAVQLGFQEVEQQQVVLPTRPCWVHRVDVGDMLILGNTCVHTCQEILPTLLQYWMGRSTPLPHCSHTKRNSLTSTLLHFLPTQSPESNPCELCFSAYKSYHRNHRGHAPFEEEITRFLPQLPYQ